jgi:amino acid transporter/nucleotide-binding universal stress UspA family protein
MIISARYWARFITKAIESVVRLFHGEYAMKKFSTEVQLSREMSLLDATMIGVGAMIGAGIFVLTGIAAGVAGPGLIFAFFLNGLIALLTAMSYAELGSCYHDAGGGYLWVKEGLPKWNGFLSGWMSWFAHAVACSLYAIGFGAYFEHLLKEFNIVLPKIWFLSPQKMLAAIIAIIFGYVNFRGASETGKIGNIVTMTKIIILGIFVACGLHVMLGRSDWAASFSPFLPNGWAGIIRAMGLTFIAFQGFEVISQASEEIRNPKKNIPRAVFLSLLIVVPIYVLVAVASLGSIVPEGMRVWDYLGQNKETALVEVSKTFFVGGGVMLLFGGLISTISALNATVYSSSRVAFAMGRDRNFPAFFSGVHAKNFTPHRAIFVSLIIVVVMSLSFHIEDVASAADIMFLLLFLQVNVTLIRLRKMRPDLDRGFWVPFFPYLTIAGIILLFSLALYLFTYSPLGWLVTAAWIGAGLVVYKAYASKREIKHIQKLRALERLEKKEYRVLVAVGNLLTAERLSPIAVAIANKNHAEVLYVHVIEVPENKPLEKGLGDQEQAMVLLERATEFSNDPGLRARSIVKVARSVSQGIVDVAVQENCNFVILSRQKDPTFLERLFSSVIDSVLQKSPCEVAVLHGEIHTRPIRNILIPYSEDIHTRLALEVAPALAGHFGSKVTLGVVMDPELSFAESDERLQRIRERLVEYNLSADIDVVTNDGILQGVIILSQRADLILMGGRTGDFMELLLRRSLVQEITEETHCPVLWIKEYEEKESFWISLLRSSPKEVDHHGQ